MANTVYIITNTVTVAGVKYEKGKTVALTPAQVTAIGAGNLRVVSVPPANVSSSPTHDSLGEGVAVSNSS